MALAIFFYSAPIIAVGTIGGVAIGYNLRHGSDRTSRLLLEALGLALFWPGGVAFWRYKAKGYRMDWWWLPVAVFFYLGFVAAELAYEDEDLWFS